MCNGNCGKLLRTLTVDTVNIYIYIYIYIYIIYIYILQYDDGHRNQEALKQECHN